LKFSLILATVGRTAEIDRFFKSLQSQNYVNFEVIVVDQNEDKRLDPILAVYHQFMDIIHVKSAKGLSKARNVGLKYITGDVVAFPDDDCWYPVDILEKVRDVLISSDLDGISCRCVDINGNDSVGIFTKEHGIIDMYNVWNRSTSATIFLKSSVIKRINPPFDESLGVGSGTIYGSGEDIDLVINAIKAGAKIYYTPEIQVFHPNPTLVYNDKTIKRAFSYGCGLGKVLKKHNYPVWYKSKVLIRPLGGCVLSLLALKVSKARYHMNAFIGRLRGML